MAEKNVNVRIYATGGGQIVKELVGIGEAGDDAFAKVGAGATAASGKLRGVGGAAGRAGQAASGMVQDMRQTTMQLSQVAQQASATGNWVQAFAIQLPDLALRFGPVGMAAGAVAGALLTMAPALIGAGREAKRLEEAMDAAKESSDAMMEAANAAALPIDKLREKYGDWADEIQRASGALAEVTRGTAEIDALAAVRELRSSLGRDLPNMGAFLGPSGEVMAGYEGARATLLEQTVKKLEQQVGATADEAMRLAEGISRLGRGGTMEAAIAEGEELLSAIAAIEPETDQQQRALSDMATQIGSAMDLAKQNVEAVTTATGRMTTAFETSASTLERLQGTIGTMFPRASGVLDQVGGWIGGLGDKVSGEFGAASKGILDLIGWAEGTDKGRGYNETLGYGAFTGGPVNLVNMKIDEVLALQQRMLAHPENTYNSSAVGRYQIVGKTLRGLKGTLGLTGEELFDQQMQDRLAMELVRGRMQQGTQRGWYDEWQGFEAKGVSMAAITGALGIQSVGVDPSVAEKQSREAAAAKVINDELKRSLDLRTDFMASLDQQVRMAAMEAEATGKSVYEQTRLRAEMALTQDLRAKGIDLNERIAGTERTYGQAVRESADAMATAAQEQAAQEGRRQQVEEAARNSAEMMKRFQDDLTSGFTSAFQSVIDGTKSVSEAFKEMVAQMLAQRAAEQFSEGIGGLIGAAFGGGGDPLTAALAGAGAPVARGGFMSGLGRLAAQAMHVTVGVDPNNGNITAFTQRQVSAGMRQADAMMPSRVTSINRDPLRR